MKTKRKDIFVIFLAIFAIFVMACGGLVVSKSQTVFANETTEEITTITKDDGVLDEALFQKLLDYYNSVKTNEKVRQLKTDMFVDDAFLGQTLELVGKTGERINSLKNFDLFDMKKFAAIDLSHNNLTDLGTVLRNGNYQQVFVSDNFITSFDWNALNYSYILSLDISTNKIATCNLQEFFVAGDEPEQQVVINAQDNFIKVANLTLPNDEKVVVKLSHNLLNKTNLLEKLEVETLSQNIQLGFQGAKYYARYGLNDSVKLEFYGLEELSQITLQKGDTSSVTAQQIIARTMPYDYVPTSYQDEAEILQNQTYTFNKPGYYKIVFTTIEEEKTGLYQDINFYIMPNAPTYVMYQDGKEIERTAKVTSPVDVKIENVQDNVTYVFKNGGDYVIGSSITINTPGRNYYSIYQIIDGCLSDVAYLSVTYEKSVATGWTFILLGATAFLIVGWIVYINIPKIASIGIGKKTRGNKKKNLD